MSRFIEFQGGDVEAYLRSQEDKDLLRFITCGSVDDGKSTLIGRLLYEAKMLFEDQLSALEADSRISAEARYFRGHRGRPDGGETCRLPAAGDRGSPHSLSGEPGRPGFSVQAREIEEAPRFA